MNKNIRYDTGEIASFYKKNRIKWENFYPSERYIFEAIGLNRQSHVLDIGCGCGGLGNALKERFGILHYTGVDINEKAILAGRALYPEFNLLAGDILNVNHLGINPASFDTVVSLSCIDWNVEFDKMLSAAMQCLKPGGKFVSSFRLTDKHSIISIDSSFQYINFNNKLEGERAPYVIMNYGELMQKLLAYNPKQIHAYGYNGKPGSTAVTPYQEICFSVFAITKGPADTCEFNIELPELVCNVSEK